jgi:LuxR family maltose regulon positive regulatory protein
MPRRIRLESAEGPRAPPEQEPHEGLAPLRWAITGLLKELASIDAPSSEGEPTPGKMVGRFELLRRIGTGGFGVVFEARDSELGRRVAFKLLKRDRALEPERREDLVKEAAAVAQLNHENIVMLHDLGRAEFGPFLVMELLEGETLARRIRRGPLPLGAAVRIATAVARGLAHAHARGVVHSDLKPSNVFLCRDGRVKVMDFGLATVFGSSSHSGGTPGYMAPEQGAGKILDARADVYSFGVMLAEMLTARLPRTVSGGPGRRPRVQVPRVRPPLLSALIRACLASDRRRRPADGRSILRSLRSATRHIEAQPANRVVALARPGTVIGKVTRPAVPEAIPRPRLFRRVSSAIKQHRVVWIGAPAGSGKTTLVASFLRAHSRPSIWYQFDSRDADPASFFYYLREAARMHASRAVEALPLLTPEYLLGLDAYARHFFEQLGARLRPGTMLVLDNFQDLPEEAPIHGVLPTALATLPDGVTVLVLSRFAPPPPFAKFITQGHVVQLDGGELNLTRRETRLLAVTKGVRRFSQRSAAEMHAMTSGWMAATVLLLARRARAASGVPTAPLDSQQVLFDYFASEIFDLAPEAIRRFLVESSLMPQMSASTAEALTGHPRAAEILSELVRRNLFTFRLSSPEPQYRYHPLFRSFLRARGPGLLGSERWLAATLRAAEILVESGSSDEAGALLAGIGDHELLVRLIRDKAPEMARQGRLASIASWLQALPPSVLEKDPWLLYWSGTCLKFEPPVARRHFERAYDLFRARHDVVGRLLAWSGLVQTFFFVWDSFDALDPWIEEMDGMLLSGLQFPSAEVEAQVTYGMLASLMWRYSWREDIGSWLDRASALLESDAPAGLRTELAAYLTFHAVSWKGDYEGGARLLERMRPLLMARDVSPLARILWDVMEAHVSARLGDGPACFAAVERGITTASRTGVFGLDRLLAIQGIYGGLVSGDLALARRYYDSAAAQIRGERANACHLQQLGAWIDLCAGDVPAAGEKARASLSLGRACGADIAPVWAEHTLAHVLIEKGEYDEALTMLERCLDWARRVDDGAVEHHALLSIAYAWLSCGEEDEALPFLREGLRLGNERRYLTPPWIGWRRDVMARLLDAARRHDIEPNHTAELLAVARQGPTSRRLAPAPALPSRTLQDRR